MSNTRKAEPARRGSKIRFVMVEADVDDGSLSDVVSAISNALRPQTAQVVYRTALAAPATGEALPATANDESPVGETTAETEDPVSSAPAGPARPRARYRPKVEVIKDLDLDSPTSFEEYALERGPRNQKQQFLTIATWLKEYRGVPNATLDHAYTCILKLSWNVAPDMSDPFRKLEKEGFGTYSKATGFEINHLGVGFVNKKFQKAKAA